MIDVLRSYVAARKFRLHDFVVMPDHLHLLVTVGDGMTVEKGHAVSQGRILIPLEEGMRSLGRGLAAWLLRDARGVSAELQDRKSTRLNSSHLGISYAVFCLKKKKV